MPSNESEPKQSLVRIFSHLSPRLVKLSSTGGGVGSAGTCQPQRNLTVEFRRRGAEDGGRAGIIFDHQPPTPTDVAKPARARFAGLDTSLQHLLMLKVTESFPCCSPVASPRRSQADILAEVLSLLLVVILLLLISLSPTLDSYRPLLPLSYDLSADHQSQSAITCDKTDQRTSPHQPISDLDHPAP
eukprot:765335-Hanusia_phi.AAC.3